MEITAKQKAQLEVALKSGFGSVQLGTIEDVSVSTKEFILQRWGTTFYTIGHILIAVAVLAFFSGITFFIFLPILWFAIGYGIANKLVYIAFLQQFATKNGFTYQLLGDITTVKGNLFNRGHSKGMTSVVSGRRGELPVRFFLYTYTTGSGKNSTTHEFTVAEVTFGGHVPPMIVDTKDDWYVDGTWGGKHKKLSLGNAFDECFTLSVAEEFEIEALEIFTPEVMEGVVTHGKGYSFEFIENHLYVWKQGHPKKSTELQAILSLAQYLINTLAYRISRLHGDVDAVAETQRVR